MAATAVRNDLRLIGIVLGESNATTRNNEMMDLLDYGYQNLKVTTLKNKGDIVKKVKLDKADSEIVDIVLKNDLNITQGIDQELGEYDYKIEVGNFKLPVKVGEVVGSIKVYDGGKLIKEGELTVSKDIKALGFLKLLGNELIDLISGEF